MPGTASTLHIGQMIEAELRRQERTVTWFARQLHCDRRNVYDVFHRSSIDTSMLMRICLILHTDFFAALAEAYTRLQDSILPPPRKEASVTYFATQVSNFTSRPKSGTT